MSRRRQKKVGSRSRAAGFEVVAVLAAMCWVLPLCWAQAEGNDLKSGTAAIPVVSAPAGDYVIGPDDVLAVNCVKPTTIDQLVTELSLQNRPGGGLRIQITLPLAR